MTSQLRHAVWEEEERPGQGGVRLIGVRGYRNNNSSVLTLLTPSFCETLLNSLVNNALYLLSIFGRFYLCCGECSCILTLKSVKACR